MQKMNRFDLCQYGPRVLRHIAALGSAALLAACGGGDPDYYSLEVQVSGLNQQAITLKSTLGTGQEEQYTVTKEGIQPFPISIARGGSYSLTVLDSGSLVCDVKNGAASNVTTTPPPVIVTCSRGNGSLFSVGGTISGLTAGQAFTARLNPDVPPVYFSKNGSYQFSTRIVRGGRYNVQIVTQQQGLFCYPANGTGTIDNANATVDIGCKTMEKAWRIHAQVTGLAEGNVLALHNQQPGHVDEVRLFAKEGTQTFEQAVPDQGEYTVFIGADSQLNGQLCSVASGNSSGNARSDITVQIQCVVPPPTSFPISVNVTGLYDGNQLVVQNQTSTELMTLTSAKTQGTFDQPIGIGQPYSVQITTLPTLQACELTNGSGTVNGPVTVNVSCGEPAITTVYSTPPLEGGDAPYYGYPVGLVKGIDGYFYGITTRVDVFWPNVDDRISRAGSVFKMDPDNPGALQTMAGFQGSSCTFNAQNAEVGTGGLVSPFPTGIIQTQTGQLVGMTFGGAQPLVTNSSPDNYYYECSGANYRTGNLLFRGTVFNYVRDPLIKDPLNQFLYQIGRQDQATAIQNAGPVSGLIQDQNGNVYGITYGKVFAGATAKSTIQSAGTVFKWTRDGQWVPLYVFTNPDYTANPIWNATFGNGFYPSGKLMLDGNYLYGTTERGGSGVADAGAVFRIDLTKSDPDAAFEVLYRFDSTQAPYVRPAYYMDLMKDYFFTDPYASRYSGLTKGGDGHLYGVRRDGGANGAGAIYRLVANLSGAFVYEQLYSFPASRGTPILELIEINGIFYGTTLVGGDTGMGSLYRFNPKTRNVVTIHSFKGATDNSDGQTPGTALILGDDGKSLYGATTRGGAHDQGAIYKLTW